MKRVYMDANATTPLLPEVVEAMRPYWMEHFGNASSIHLDGQRAHAAVAVSYTHLDVYKRQIEDCCR